MPFDAAHDYRSDDTAAAGMAQYYHDARDYLYDCDFDTFPDEAKQLVSSLEVGFSHEAKGKIRIRFSWIDGWWFWMVDGRGIVDVRSRSRPSANHALLSIALSGQNRVRGARCPAFPRAGEMMLMEQSGGGITSIGEFRYIIAFVPKSSLATADVAYDLLRIGRAVPALVGGGGVLYAAVRATANGAGQRSSKPSLALALPGIAQNIRDIFTADEPCFVQEESVTYQMKKIIIYLEDHISSPRLSAEEVSSACGLSKRQFFRLFSRSNDTFSNKLNRIRIEKARDLLMVHPDLPIREIAAATGFSGLSYFSKVFQSVVGTCPRQFRRNHAAYSRNLSD